MGYYVITDPECFPLKYIYVEEEEDLKKIEEMNKKSIIIYGTLQHPPQQVATSVQYHQFGQDWYRAEVKAQQVFAKLATWRGWILENSGQESSSFQVECVEGTKEQVKKGNLLIRRGGNLIIEVKCRTFYGRGRQKYFFFSEQELKKYLEKEKQTRFPVIVAVFQRKKDVPLENTLCMISVSQMNELSKVSEREKTDEGYVYRIPLKKTVAGFDLIKDYPVKEKEDKVDLGLDKVNYSHSDETANVIVAYYKNQEHLDWIVNNGLYNFRGITGRGAVEEKESFPEIRYILLHTKGEHRTGKLFQILNNSPVMYSKKLLIERKYPGMPQYEFYLVYQVIPVMEKELQDREWDITKFPGYLKGYNTALPFVVPLSELLKKYE